MKIRSEGKDEFERFDNAMTKLLSVSHEEMLADWMGHSHADIRKAVLQ